MILTTWPIILRASLRSRLRMPVTGLTEQLAKLVDALRPARLHADQHLRRQRHQPDCLRRISPSAAKA
jgi:hypothetical protein